MEYRKRIADKLLKEQLDAMGAVLVEGPKACGKTTTAEQVAGSVLYMADPRTLRTNLQIADTDITILLKGKTPRLIDEWQVVPQFWDAIRFTVGMWGNLFSRVLRYLCLHAISCIPVLGGLAGSLCGR